MAEYIDKNKAITAVGEAIADGASWFDALERIPPADVRPVVRGRWERKCDGVCYWSECSNCEEYPPKNRYGQEWLSDFCPNCGADMREEPT